MEVVNHIWSPSAWKKIQESPNRMVSGDIIYKLIIGNSLNETKSNVTFFISKAVYDKIMKNEYTITIFPYAINPVLIFNHTELVPPVKGTKIDQNELSDVQKEYLKNLTAKRALSLKKVKR